MTIDEKVVESVIEQYMQLSEEEGEEFIDNGFRRLQVTSPGLLKLVKRMICTMLEEAGGSEADVSVQDAAFYVFWTAFIISEAACDPICRTTSSLN